MSNRKGTAREIKATKREEAKARQQRNIDLGYSVVDNDMTIRKEPAPLSQF